MDKKSDDQFIIMQAKIEHNKKDSDKKTKNLREYLTVMIASMMDKIKTYKSSSDKKYLPKPQYTTTFVPDNKKDPLMEG